MCVCICMFDVIYIFIFVKEYESIVYYIDNDSRGSNIIVKHIQG